MTGLYRDVHHDTSVVSDEQLHFYRLCGTSMYSNVLGVGARAEYYEEKGTWVEFTAF